MSSPACHQRRPHCARGRPCRHQTHHHRLKNGGSRRDAGLFSATVIRSAGRLVPAADPVKAKMAVMPPARTSQAGRRAPAPHGRRRTVAMRTLPQGPRRAGRRLARQHVQGRAQRGGLPAQPRLPDGQNGESAGARAPPPSRRRPRVPMCRDPIPRSAGDGRGDRRAGRRTGRAQRRQRSARPHRRKAIASGALGGRAEEDWRRRQARARARAPPERTPGGRCGRASVRPASKRPQKALKYYRYAVKRPQKALKYYRYAVKRPQKR